MNKSLIGIIGSFLLMLVGIFLRLNAEAMAWPRGGYSYSGARADTSWGHTEAAIGEIGIALVSVGILIFLITYVHWLFVKPSHQ